MLEILLFPNSLSGRDVLIGLVSHPDSRREEMSNALHALTMSYRKFWEIVLIKMQ
jgi:hypothetical protein